MAGNPLHTVLDHLRRLHRVADTSQRSDGDLLHAFAAHNDQDAFAAVVTRHASLVWGVCRRILGHQQDAEDAFQATFLALARRAGSARWQANVGGWLHTVAQRLAVRLRKQAEQRRIHEREASRMPPADASLRELAAIVDEELQRLPAKYREPLLLHYLEGATAEAAARQLHLSRTTFYNRLAYGRDLLRERLRRQGLSLAAPLLVAALTAEAEAASRSLIQATIGGVMGNVPERVAALVVEALGATAMIKLKIGLALGFLLGIAAGGVAMLSPRMPMDLIPQAERPAEQPKAEDKTAVRVDRYGDPLPPGALRRFGSVRLRHCGWLERLAFSPDGRWLAYAGDDGIRLWETASGRPIRHFADRADSLAFLHGGRRILAGGENLIVWDTIGGKEIKRLPIKGGLRHFSMSQDGKLLAGVDSDGALLLLEAATGTVLKQLDGHEDQINPRPKGAPPRRGQILSVAFAPDGKALASACFQDKRVFLWDTATGKARHTLPGQDKPNVVRFSPDGRLLAVGGDDCSIHLWDAATGRKLQLLRGHVGGINGLAFSPDGRTLASGASGTPPNTKTALDDTTEDSTIRLWDLKTGKCRPLQGPARWVRDLAFSPDGKLLAAGGVGTAIYLIDIATGKRQQRYIGHEGRIFRVALSPDGSTLASGGEDNLIYLWDVKTSQKKAILEGHGHHISGLAFMPDGGELLSCSYDGTLRVWDWRRGEEKRRFATTNGWHYAFDLAPDGKTVLLPTGQLWDVATGKQSGTVPNIQGFQYRLVLSPDGTRVAVPGGAAAIIRDVKTGKEICRFNGHGPGKNNVAGWPSIGVECIAFEANGRTAVSGGAEGLAFIWDAETGKMLRRLQGHENPILATAFSPDGRMVATASGDWTNHKERTVRLWEVMTGKERRRFVGHQNQVTSIVFSRDGSTLISGSADGTGLIWDARGVLKPEIAKEADVERLWRLLASEDAAVAYEAECALVTQRPKDAVPLLTKRLHPTPPTDPQWLRRLLADLDSEQFTVREKAQKELEKLGDLAEPALRQTLVNKPSLEMRRRVQAVLERLRGPVKQPELLQALRAVAVLEDIGTPKARRLLEELAKGAAKSRLTREAKASLERLQRCRADR